jgi:predicted phosphodiesterase
MPVAALYDIHGNLPALEAVLHDIRESGVDQIIVGGDVVPGPMSRETLACLLSIDRPVQFIYGNGEVAVLEQLAGRDPSGVPEPYRPMMRWVAGQLEPAHRLALAGWPKMLALSVDGLGEVLFCHATPRNENECFTRLTPDARLAPIFDPLNVDVVVCGHTHMQFDRTIGRTRVVNAGSVGMPFGEAGAYWLLLGPDVQLRRTEYDLAAAAERIRATEYPQADEFAARNILHPPSEQEMLELFTRVQLT